MGPVGEGIFSLINGLCSWDNPVCSWLQKLAAEIAISLQKA